MKSANPKPKKPKPALLPLEIFTKRIDRVEDALAALAVSGVPLTIDVVDLITSLLLPEIYGDPPPTSEPSPHPAGSAGKLGAIEERKLKGCSLWHDEDEVNPFGTELQIGVALIFFGAKKELKAWRRETSRRAKEDEIAAVAARSHYHKDMIRLEDDELEVDRSRARSSSPARNESGGRRCRSHEG